MVIVITTHGSTGDIFPLIGLSVMLKEAGHDVRFATSRPFQKDIEDAGVDFYPIPPDWNQSDLASWMGKLQTVKSPIKQLKILYKATLPYLEESIDAMDSILEGADCLISSYLFPINGAIAKRRKIPFITYAFAHNTVPSRYYPPHGMPRLRGLPQPIQLRWNRFAWKICNVAVDTAINQTISRKLKKKGLSPVKDFFSKSANLVLVAVSPALMQPKTKLNKRFRFTGYCRWQSPQLDKLDQEIEAFRENQRVPILTFGSMVYQDPDAYVGRLLAHWPKDKKLIIQTGWSGFEVPKSAANILQIGPVSHDQLFRHGSVIIHHGGAGTTASALHAGKPQIVVPHIGDQDFFGSEVSRLGCGLECLKRKWPEQLYSKVETIESSKKLLECAEDCKDLLEQENGPRAALEQITSFVEAERSNHSYET